MTFQVFYVIGTRSEIIALSEARFLSSSQDDIENWQSRLKAFRVPVDRDLGLRTGQPPVEVAVGLLDGLGCAWRVRSPSAALGHGDTTSAMVAGLATHYNRISVGVCRQEDIREMRRSMG